MGNLALARRAFTLGALSGGLVVPAGEWAEAGRGGVVEGASILIGGVGAQEKLAYTLVRASSSTASRLAVIETPAKFSANLQETVPRGSAIGINEVVGSPWGTQLSRETAYACVA